MEYYEDDSPDDKDSASPKPFCSLPAYSTHGQQVEEQGRRRRQRQLYSLDAESATSESKPEAASEANRSCQPADSFSACFDTPTSHQGFDRSSSSYSMHSTRSKRRQLSHVHKSKSCSDISNLQQAIDKLYESYTKCHVCQQTDISRIYDNFGSILMLQCDNCGHPFGIDDSMSPQMLLDLLAELYHHKCIELHVGCCENTDPDQFKIEGFDGTHFAVRCLKCDKVSTLSQDFQPLKNDSKVPAVPELMCKCGNRDQELMEAHVVNEEIRSVRCVFCGEELGEEDFAATDGKGDGSMERMKPDISDPVDVESIASQASPETASGGIPVIPEHQSSPSCNPKRRSTRTLYQPDNVDSSNIPPMDPTKVPSKDPTSIPFAGKKDKSSPKYQEVHQISDLNRGDHIMWDRNLGYYHHALIEQVQLEQLQIQVLHYNGPSPTGVVARETLDPFAKGSGRLYVVEHVDPFSIHVVISRAKSRLGETKYNLATNNCEHFATWCKTGQHVSSQVMNVKDCFMKYANACYKVCPLGQVAKKSSRVFGRSGAVMMMAAMEIKGCAEDIQAATEDRKAGRLSREAFIQVVVSRTTRSLGGLAGMALGMCIPIPLVGEFIGGTVGGMIGEFAGKQFGKLVLGIADECSAAFGGKKLF